MKGIDEIAANAEQILSNIVPNATCVAQEWDDRIDCLAEPPDGTIVGEMVPLAQVTASRIGETADRLRRRLADRNVGLVNEIRNPAKITRDR